MNREDKLVYILRIICEKAGRPGKKVFQKLIYLIERGGVDLGFDYSIHYYGPYSAALDDALYRLRLQGVVDIIPEGYRHAVCLIDDDYGDEWENIFSSAEKKIIEKVIERFGSKSGRELEIITTADFVFQQLKQSWPEVSEEEAIEKVKRIKGDKFSEDEIRQALKMADFTCVDES